MFFSQMVSQRGLPFRPSSFPALEEFGASLAEATAAEDAAIREIQKSRKARKLREFTGKL